MTGGRRVWVAGVVAALLTTSGCSAAVSRTIDGLALDTLTQGLDDALAGLEVRSSAQVEALVRDARTVVVDPERTDSGVGQVEYATYGEREGGRAADAAIPVVVWHRTVGGGPFVDDGGVWHVVCARLSVDRSRTAFAAEPVGCPDDVTLEPVQPAGDDPAPHLDLDPPDAGELVTGSPPRRGSSSVALRPMSRGRADPCAADDLDLALGPPQRLTGYDAVPLLVVNTGPLACRLAAATGLVLVRDGEDVPVRTTPWRGEVVLAPRESASALVTWRPVQGIDGAAAQRLSVLGSAGPDLLPVRLASSAGTGVPTVGPGAEVTFSRWERRGYGAGGGEDPVRPDVAPRCRPEELAVTSEHPDAGSGRPLPPSVRVHLTAVTPCLLVPGVSALPDGVPDAVEGPPVLLAPGEAVDVITVTAGPDRPGEVLVADRWVAVENAPRAW
ncbi:DUF4232 domain-containing protein [Phycicoccus sp. MAQZ13P-2]|uniref:DUF4232 domain-containing protein n=1 Tax=Phycicoccus mangrovi TaxID=2840470 RepID=UPI001BFFDA90|nr:DUF4232 domain-containing protein [Phycicoccus mangrovi]MBT9255633.1 DUF4232 domain-containing protein [Phycicoccus mangrovi]MBT9275347.1 DUF4232 domain-containing protein [Phycicoccus mangrovi]